MFVDNAYNLLLLWAQERLVVNDETVQEAGGYLKFRQSFDEPWLTPIGDELLRVRLISGAAAIRCSVQLGDVELEPEAMLEAEWRGQARSWPDESEWR